MWTPLDTPVPAARVARELSAACAAVGPPPPNVRREIFPAPPDADPSVRLPLGPHPKTGRTSTLIDPTGAPIRDGRGLRASLTSTPAIDIRSPAAQRVLDGCPLLGRLAQEAQATADLDHDGRYSLASVLASVAGGEAAIHAIISWCDDYDHAITQHFIDRLHARPMGCKRLKERHPHLAEGCRCPTGRRARPYATPAARAHRGVVQPARPQRPAELARLLKGMQRSLDRMRKR